MTARRIPRRKPPRATPPAAILSPSDVASAARSRAGRPKRARVGGRIVGIDAGTIVLGDALGTVPVTLAHPGDANGLEPGDLVVAEASFARGRLGDARLVERTPGRAPAAHTEYGRLALDGVGPRLAARAEAKRWIRRYFERERFVEVETPLRVPSPGLDAHVDAVKADGGFLITSPELHMKRLVVGGLPRVYQFARTTRAGEHGALHEPEFTLLEWYRAFSGMDDVVRDAERIIAGVVRHLSGAPRARTPDGRGIDVSAPFRRITVREAFRAHAGVPDAAELARLDADEYFRVFVDRVEPAIAREPAAIVLTEFPITQAALARPKPGDKTVAERFEVYVGGVELCNGFGELTSAVEQRRRFELELEHRRRTGAPEHPIDERFLAALEEGLPEAGGNALGLDRLIMLAVGARGIADVMAFPSDRS